jgi:hypothetical protein
MNDETAENAEEERKGEPALQIIDTTGQAKIPHAAHQQM